MKFLKNTGSLNRFREPFSEDDFFEFLEKMNEYPKEKIDKIVKRYILNDELMNYIFPSSKEELEKRSLKDGKSMYDMFIKKKFMKSVCRAIDDIGAKRIPRTIATWLYSIASYAIEVQDSRWAEFKEEYSDIKPKKDVAKARDYRVAKGNLEEYDEVLFGFVKRLRKIVKSDVRDIAEVSGAPKELVELTYIVVPDKKYVSNIRLGFYANQVLVSIYKFVDEYKYNTSDIKWKSFFSGIFGEDNLPDLATFILLEGIKRVDSYGEKVKKTFNELTMFALKVLEETPPIIKDQMIELYIKRISKMFANKSFDLRANLLELDPEVFPMLVNCVKKYADQIRSIINTK